MGKVTCQISISLDGPVAGPNQSLENPIGEGGMRLHDWVFATSSCRLRQGEVRGEDGADSAILDQVKQGASAGERDCTPHHVPATLGRRGRWPAHVGSPGRARTTVVARPAVTHIKYRIAKRAKS